MMLWTSPSMGELVRVDRVGQDFEGIVTDRDAVERVWRRITREIAGQWFPTAKGGDSRIDAMDGGYVQHQ
jgi:hypothetical protein